VVPFLVGSLGRELVGPLNFLSGLPSAVNRLCFTFFDFLNLFFVS